MDYGNTKKPSMHIRLGITTLLQLAFPQEHNPNFPWKKIPWDNTVVKKKKKNEEKKNPEVGQLNLSNWLQLLPLVPLFCLGGGRNI